MKRPKKEPILHKSSTVEKLHCLFDNLHWIKLLLGRGKKYDPFLQGLHQKNYYKDSEVIIITKIAAYLGFNSGHVTKWITQIYDDIYELRFAIARFSSSIIMAESRVSPINFNWLSNF